jgi:5-methylcytosine-specific restriction endonuclease McrA
MMCSACSRNLDISYFFWKNKKKKKRHTQCKDCYKKKRKEKYASYYQRKSGEYRKRAIERRNRIKKENKEKMLLLISGKHCVDCGEKDPVTLDFHHTDSKTKTKTVSKFMADGASWNIILKEIEKCKLICSNCHRKRTAKQFGNYKLLL